MNLLEKIKKTCRQSCSNGFISLETYMSLCLENYYTKKQPLGSSGDFTTAPEISQLFGELIGFWFLEQYKQLGSPDKIYLVELGPGRGTLMSDFLRIIPDNLKKFFYLNFVEINPYLTSIQKKIIYPQKATWHNNFEDCLFSMKKKPLPLLLVANEFFDALPTRQFKVENSSWHETGIIYDEEREQLKFSYQLTSPPFSYLDQKEGDFFWEYSPKTLSILKNIGLYIQQYSGSALVIDYGSNGYNATLQAVKSHKKIDPLTLPGQADITTHVNFSSILRTLSLIPGLSTLGPIEQGLFLKNLGIDVLAKKLSSKAKNQKQLYDLYSGLYRLTSANQMGSLFKVLPIKNTRKKNY